MAFTYDTSTSVGRVRMLITDRDEANPIFQDAEIEAFLALESDSVYLAAAMALETIAVDQALVLKVIEVLDLKTDGAKVADALGKRAEALRKRENEGSAFAIVEMVQTPAAWEEKVWKDALRAGL